MERKLWGTGIHRITRALLCLFALSLLWLTTLRVSVGILSHFFDLPRFETVWAVCEAAFDEVRSQKHAHEACSERQLDVCSAQLQDSVASHARSADEVKHANSALIECMKFATMTCNIDISDFHSQITVMRSLHSRDWSLPFDKRCSNSSRSSISSYFSESSESDADIMTAVNRLSYTSNEKITTLAQFADDLNNYNIEYANNKTVAVQDAASRIQSEMQRLSADVMTDIRKEMASLLAATEQLIACIGLDNATKSRGLCSQGLGMYDRIRDLQIAMEVQTFIFQGFIEDYKKEFDLFAADVKNAIKAADNFYDSVAGASGLVSWIVENMNVFRVATELCGKGSPNWCDFSKANWFIWTPDMPADISELIIDFPDPYVLWDPYLVDLAAYRRAFDMNAAKLEAVPNSLLGQLDLQLKKIPELNLSITGVGPEDYHPPKYSNYRSINDPSLDQQKINESESILIQSGRDYDMFRQNITKFIEDKLTQSSEFLELWNETGIISGDPYLEKIIGSISGKAVQLSEFQFSAASFSFPNIEPDLVFGSLNSFLEVLYLFDNLYRIWLSLRIVYLYWKNATIGVSHIDVSDVENTYVELQDSTACQYELHNSISRSLLKNSQAQNRLLNSYETRSLKATAESSKSHRRNLAVEAYIRSKPLFSSSSGTTNSHPHRSNRSSNERQSVHHRNISSDATRANNQMASYSWGNTSLTVWKLVLYFVSHFWVQIGIAIGFVCIVGYTAYALYIPLYQDYLANCVSHTSSEGTFLAKNLYAAGFNFAASGGDARLARTAVEYNAKAAGLCAQNRGVTEKSFRNHSRYMDLLVSSQQKQYDQALEFRNCINASSIDDSYLNICRREGSCPINPRTNDPFESMRSYINSPYCNNFTKSSLVELSALCNADLSLLTWDASSEYLTPSPAAVFNCSSIPKCVTTCSGPEPSMLRAQTDQCSCMLEWTFHAGLLYFAIALGIYSLINISRSLLNKALIYIIMFRVQENPMYRSIISTNALGQILIPEVRYRRKEMHGPKNHTRQEFSGYGNPQSPYDAASDVIFKDNPLAPKGLKRHDDDLEIGRRVPSMNELDIRDFLHPDAVLRFVISSKISDLESRVKTSGALYFIASILVHAPWIIILVVMKDNLAYQPSASSQNP